MVFKNRISAGEKLATFLEEYKHSLFIARAQNKHPDTLIVAIPRGGVIVAYPVAVTLNAPLEVLCAKKIGAPYNREFAIGAIVTGGEAVIAPWAYNSFDNIDEYLNKSIEQLKAECKYNQEIFNQGRESSSYKDKIVIIIDDGIATGMTTFAAIKTIKAHNPAQLILAVPVISAQTAKELSKDVDKLITIIAPDDLQAVGQYYDDFRQVNDKEVLEVIEVLNKRTGAPE